MAALRIQENEEYVRYVTAGGEPEKWRWVFNLERYKLDGVSPEEVAELITQRVGKNIKETGGSKKQFFKQRELPPMLQLDDGRLVDIDGNITEMPPNAIFMPKHLVDAME